MMKVRPDIVAGSIAEAGWRTYPLESDPSIMMAHKKSNVLEIGSEYVSGYVLDLFATPEAGEMLPLNLLDIDVRDALEIIWEEATS